MKQKSFTELGASAVEAAILVPLMLALLGSILDYSIFLYVNHQVDHAVREGARYAVTQNPFVTANVTNRVNMALAQAPFITDVSVTVTPPTDRSDDLISDKMLSVNVTAKCPSIFMRLVNSNSHVINSKVISRYEWQSNAAPIL